MNVPALDYLQLIIYDDDDQRKRAVGGFNDFVILLFDCMWNVCTKDDKDNR